VGKSLRMTCHSTSWAMRWYSWRRMLPMPAIFGHAMPGCRALIPSSRLRLASEMISMPRSTSQRLCLSTQERTSCQPYPPQFGLYAPIAVRVQIWGWRDGRKRGGAPFPRRSRPLRSGSASWRPAVLALSGNAEMPLRIRDLVTRGVFSVSGSVSGNASGVQAMRAISVDLNGGSEGDAP
jgi:hypothetical protein